MSRVSSLRAAITDRLAAQWASLGYPLAGPVETSVLDIEAAIAVTATLDTAAGARVRDAAIGWCAAYGAAVNASRLHRVVHELGVTPDQVDALAAEVAAIGGPRWSGVDGRRVVRGERGDVSAARSGMKQMRVRDLAGAPRLVWRLRSAFGVNARADVLAALIVDPHRTSTIGELAQRTRFGKRNVAVAVESMALAGVVEVRRVANRDHVRLPAASPFASWLDLDQSRGIADWTDAWRVALTVARSLDASEAEPTSVQIVEGRATAAALDMAAAEANLPRPDLARVGPAWAVEYERWVEALTEALATF